jgi:hypothetical protein
MEILERTPSEWFQVAALCYIDKHQACAWCGGPHRVFRHQRGSRTEYYCHGCDFRVTHDQATGQYTKEPGEANSGVVRATMGETS